MVGVCPLLPSICRLGHCTTVCPICLHLKQLLEPDKQRPQYCFPQDLHRCFYLRGTTRISTLLLEISSWSIQSLTLLWGFKSLLGCFHLLSYIGATPKTSGGSNK